MAKSLFSELKRRNVFKVATAYVVLAWVIIQVTGEAAVAFGMPDWVNTVVFFFGLIGFPFVMLFAWAYELTPDGIKPESEVDRDTSITDVTGQKLNYTIMVLLAIGMGYFIYESRFQAQRNAEQTVEPVTASNAEQPQPTVASDASGSSIAVMPFVNMSSDPEQEFFSDGISEEILNVLAKIPNLHVTSRSSAFAFKGKEINLSEVANKLGVANILEGSVRKSGNKIRITAQLIEADTDKHLWSETYDRELIDIFTIQDEISGAIVTALKDKLGITEFNLNATETVDIAAHEAYLKGRYLLEMREEEDLNKAIAEFDKAIAIEPNYAHAWMAKAWATSFLSEYDYGSIPNEIAMERAQAALDRAKVLDPLLPEIFGVQGLIYSNNQMPEEAVLAFEKAIELNPNYSNAYTWLAKELGGEEHEKAIKAAERAYRLDPISILASYNYALALVFYGQLEEVKSVVEHMASIDPQHFFTYGVKAVLYTHLGEYGKASYYTRNAYLTNDRDRTTDWHTNRLATLGLVDEAVKIVKESDRSERQYGYTQNLEMMISAYRDKYPRSENDHRGFMQRGMAEFLARNFEQAIFYYSKSNNCDNCDFLIYSHKMLGNEDIYKEMLRQRWVDFNKYVTESGFTALWLIDDKIDLLLLGDRVDEAIEELSALLDKGMPIDYFYTFGWELEPLHSHEKWPELLQRSNQIAERERAIYLKMVEQESSDI